MSFLLTPDFLCIFLCVFTSLSLLTYFHIYLPTYISHLKKKKQLLFMYCFILFLSVLVLHFSTQDLFLWCMSSVIVAHKLRYPKACRILVPWPGLEPMSLVFGGIFLTTGPPGKFLYLQLLKMSFSFPACCSFRNIDYHHFNLYSNSFRIYWNPSLILLKRFPKMEGTNN